MAAKELKEMDNPVTRGAKAGDPMKKVDDSTSPGASASYEDLGGPTPQNYKSTDNSAKVKSANIKTVQDCDCSCATRYTGCNIASCTRCSTLTRS